jgi:N-acetylglucosamine-6-phosphate deacetylase
MFGGERIVLVSDALRCCGMPEGELELGGQMAYLKGGVARLADGTIAGAATHLYDCMRNAILFGVPEEDAVRAATANPAAAIGVLDQVGTIATGKLADFVVCRGDYTAPRVFMGGKQIS